MICADGARLLPAGEFQATEVAKRPATGED